MYEEDDAMIACRPRYTVTYEGRRYFGDQEGYNNLSFNGWEQAISEYKTLVRWGCDVWLVDNEYGVTFHLGEWD